VIGITFKSFYYCLLSFCASDIYDVHTDGQFSWKWTCVDKGEGRGIKAIITFTVIIIS